MNFKQISLPLSIRTTNANPIDVFFTPVLADATSYDVAVGFFSTQWIRDAAEGIARFAVNGGKARWVVSPRISEEDYSSISCTPEVLSSLDINELAIKSFHFLYNELRSNTRTILAWLIKDGILSFKIGIPQNELSGMFHAKMGIFRDSSENGIGFSGSYNLTGNAKTNWEKIDIFCDWKSEESKQRVDEIGKEFNEIWEGKDPNLAVYEPSDEALKPFLAETQRSNRPYRTKSSCDAFSLPEGYELREYQEKAINAWIENDGAGFFSMATGSGKTITALATAARVANFALSNKKPQLIVITVPYQHLAEQWAVEAKLFGFTPLLCYGGAAKWNTSATRIINELYSGARGIAFFIAVNDTFVSKGFQKLISGLHRQLFLISDEAHSLGSNVYRSSLPRDARFRLGLSATPVRHGDEEGSLALENFFGKIVFEFSLKDAIDNGYLCKYRYYPVLCTLNSDEMEEYKDISTRIGKEFARSGVSIEDCSDGLRFLLIARARLITRIASKISNLRQILSDLKDSSYNLIYCGDTTSENGRHVEQVTALLGNELGMRVHKFTSDESSLQRKELLDLFSSGEIQALVAIRCLDEGVDIPRTETAFILASSVNPRQYIQRRGRVLRKAPGKKLATIYDFVAVPNIEGIMSLDSNSLSIEKGLIRREIQRINEFAELSINPGESLERLSKIKDYFNLLDL